MIGGRVGRRREFETAIAVTGLRADKEVETHLALATGLSFELFSDCRGQGSAAAYTAPSPIPLGRGEVRPRLLGDLGEAVSQNIGGLPGQRCAEVGLLEAGAPFDERVSARAQQPKMPAGREAEQVGGR